MLHSLPTVKTGVKRVRELSSADESEHEDENDNSQSEVEEKDDNEESDRNDGNDHDYDDDEEEAAEEGNELSDEDEGISPEYIYSSESKFGRSLRLLLSELNKQHKEQSPNSSTSSSSSSSSCSSSSVQVGFSNEFCVSGRCDCLQLDVLSLPALSISGIGAIPLPLLNDTAEQKASIQKLISCAHLAPFGLGTETVQDLSVRHVFKFDADKVTIQHPNFQSSLYNLVTHCCKSLGCLSANGKAEELINVQLYNALVYLPGCHFKCHRDTEKLPGMFGTLIITLPCSFKGGEIILRQHNKEHIADFGANDNSCNYTSHYLAFYADVQHEVKPLQSGVRIALVYNLAWKNGQRKIDNAVADKYAVSHALNAALICSPLVCFTLSHLYTHASFSRDGIAALKGSDGWLASILQRQHDDALPVSSTSSSFSPMRVGMIHRTLEQDVDSEDAFNNSYRLELYDAAGQKSYFETKNELTSSFHPRFAVSLHENRIGRTKWNFDKRSTQFTGNEGATRETLYHVAVLVVVSPIVKVLETIRLNPQVYLPCLQQFIDEQKANKTTMQITSAEALSTSLVTSIFTSTSSALQNSSSSFSSSLSSFLHELSELSALGVSPVTLLHGVFAEKWHSLAWIVSNADFCGEFLQTFGDSLLFLKFMRALALHTFTYAPDGNSAAYEKVCERFVQCAVRTSNSDMNVFTGQLKKFVQNKIAREFKFHPDISIYAPFLLSFLQAAFNIVRSSEGLHTSASSALSSSCSSSSSSMSTFAALGSLSVCGAALSPTCSLGSANLNSDSLHSVCVAVCEAFCLGILKFPQDRYIDYTRYYTRCELYFTHYIAVIVLMHSVAVLMVKAFDGQQKQKELCSQTDNTVRPNLWKQVCDVTEGELRRVDIFWTTLKCDYRNLKSFCVSMMQTARKWFRMDFSGFALNWLRTNLKPHLQHIAQGLVQKKLTQLQQRVPADSYKRLFGSDDDADVQDFLRSDRTQLICYCNGIAAARKLARKLSRTEDSNEVTVMADGIGKSAKVTMQKTAVFPKNTQKKYDKMQRSVDKVQDILEQLNLEGLFSDVAMR